MATLRRTLSVVGTATANALRPRYLRHLARETDRWGWEHARRAVKPITFDDLEAQAGGPFELRLLRAPFKFGDTGSLDVLAVCTLAAFRKPRAVFEFGTFRGFMTINMLLNAPDDARAYTLDIPPAKRGGLTEGGWDRTIDDGLIGELYRGTPYAARIEQILCDSRELDTSPYAGKMDFIFIDASHEYEFVVNDTAKARQMLSQDGVIAWHDYATDHPGVGRHLEELARDRDIFWVVGTRVAFCRGRW